MNGFDLSLHASRGRIGLLRFSLSFARTQLARGHLACVEVAPLSLLVGVLVNSGRRFLNLFFFSYF